MKPSEIIKLLKEESDKRYGYVDIDTRNVAALLNLVMKCADILDAQHGRIEVLENKFTREE